jgi:hypothetical protein
MQPLGCNLRTYGQEEHPDYAFQALLGVDTIGGQLLPSIFAEADSVPTSQVLTYCVNVQIIIYVNFIFIFHTGNIQVYSRYPDIWEFSGSDKISKAAYMYMYA